MQAIIMAAGKGSRLGSLVENKHKSFLEIKGKKLIEYNIRMLQKYGIKDIIIVVGYREQDFVELIKDMEGVRLSYNPFYELVNVLGSFWIGQSELTEDFIYLHADTICDLSIFENLLASEGDIALPIDYKVCDEEAMKVRIQNGKVVELTKKMSSSIAAGEFIGIAKIKKSILNELKIKTTEVLKEKEYMAFFEAAIQKLIDDGKCDVIPVATEGAFWAEIDFLEDYKLAIEKIPDSLVLL